MQLRALRVSVVTLFFLLSLQGQYNQPLSAYPSYLITLPKNPYFYLRPNGQEGGNGSGR